ncbi:MAG: uncharacterized LabA/DUF88 family protein [Planctomycetota bacterium]|jgi:uncharacterized LabA/DUF88 family protein
MSDSSYAKVGVFVDGTNLRLNGGYGMRFDVLREFASRGNACLLRLNTYLAFDAKRAQEDESYRRGQDGFTDNLRDFGYKVQQKAIRRYENNGEEVAKVDMDVDITVDLLTQTEGLDSVLLCTGDGDFVPAVRALQNRGIRVELLAFENVSGALRRECDQFYSGYLIPDMLPFRDQASEAPEWGQPGSRVRGTCYSHTGRGYGFLRYMKEISPDLWLTNTRYEDSPYESAFLHDSALPEGVEARGLPSRALTFEFDLSPGDNDGDTLQAKNVTLAAPR